MKRRTTPTTRTDFRICVYLDEKTWNEIQAISGEESTSSVIRKLIAAEYQQTHKTEGATVQ